MPDLYTLTAVWRKPTGELHTSTPRRDYTFRTGVGYDWIDDDVLGGDGSGEVRKAFEDSGLRFSF